MPVLTVESLPVGRLGEAYPLVRAVAGISLERWQAFGAGLVAEGGGALAVFAEDCRLHGVAAWRPASSLRHECSIAVELIATFELTRSGVVRRRLAEALEQVARSRGCRSLVFTVAASDRAGDAARRQASWNGLGLELEAVSMVRRLPVEAPGAPAAAKDLPDQIRK